MGMRYAFTLSRGSPAARSPYVAAKYAMISSSVLPSLNISRICSRHCRHASVGQTSNGVFSHTGQYNFFAILFTSSSVGVVPWAEANEYKEIERSKARENCK